MADELQDGDGTVAEPTTDQDRAEDAAFGEAADEASGAVSGAAAVEKPAAAVEPVSDSVAPAKAAGANPAAPAPVVAPVAEPSAKDALAKAVAERARQEREDTVLKASQRILDGGAQPATAPAATPGATTPSPFDEVLKLVGDMAVRDAPGEGESALKNVAEFAKAYPAAVDATIAIATKIAEKIVAERLGPVAQSVQQREFAEARSKVFDALAGEGHEDAQEICDSEKFNTWLDAQSQALQAMADGGSVKDKALILAAYKEESGITTTGKGGNTVAPAVAAAKARQARSNALHAPLRPSRNAPPTNAGEADESSLDEAFDTAVAEVKQHNKFRRE